MMKIELTQDVWYHLLTRSKDGGALVLSLEDKSLPIQRYCDDQYIKCLDLRTAPICKVVFTGDNPTLDSYIELFNQASNFLKRVKEWDNERRNSPVTQQDVDGILSDLQIIKEKLKL